MTSKMNRGAAAILAALLALGGAAVAAEEIAPDFTLPDLKGEDVTLSDALADGPVVLDFWATWCKPCRKAMPKLRDLAREFADDGVTVLAVSIDDPRSRAKVASTARSLGLESPVLLDGDKTVASLYRVHSVPTTILIDRDGTVASVHRGYRDGDEAILAREIRELLAGRDER